MEKVLSVLSPSGSTKSNESVPLEPDAPLEYRNLLMDISGGKSDHIMWISSLQSYDWYGDGRFDFNMDKFGVPFLKNGDYKLNLSVEIIDRFAATAEDPTSEKYKIYWEGNYWSPVEDDCIVLSVQTEAILVKKAANVLKKLGVGRGDSVLLILPLIVQLPIILMACVRVGAVTSLLSSVSLEEVDNVVQTLAVLNPKIVVTADGYWSGAELVQLKANVDLALSMAAKQHEVKPHVIVIQHGNPDQAGFRSSENIAEPQFVGKRPIVDLETPMNEKRDFNWSRLMLGASDDCKPELMDTEDPMIQVIRKRNTGWSTRTYSTSQMALLAGVLKNTLGTESKGAIWPLLDNDNLIFITSLLAIPLSASSLLLFEGKLDFPNPERVWEIITKYKVETILLNCESTQTLMRKEVHMANVSARSLRTIITVFKSKEDNEDALVWIKKTFPQAEHVSIVY